MTNPVIANNDRSNVIYQAGPQRTATFTEAAGAQDYAEGTVMAVDSVSLKSVPWVSGGATNENGISKNVVTYAFATTGNGDSSLRVMQGGQVRLDKLIEHATGDNSNITQAVRDQLRDYGITVVDVTDESVLDNQ